MKKSSLLLIISLLLASVPARGGAPIATTGLAFTHVNDVEVESGRLLKDRTVLIYEDRVRAVVPAGRARLARGTRVVDATGKYLIPGLWDMHVHLFRHVDPPRTHTETFFPLFVANGVTGVRDMFTNFEDFPLLQEMRRDIASGRLTGPRIAAAGVMVDGTRPGTDAPSRPGSLVAHNGAEARAVVREARARGLDFVKVYSVLPREAYFAVADESRKLGITFAGHVPNDVGVAEASDAGQRSMEHLRGGVETCSREKMTLTEWLSLARRDLGQYARRLVESQDEGRCRSLFEHLARNKSWQGVDLSLKWANIGDPRWRHSPNLRYVPRKWQEGWEAAKADSDRRLSEGDRAALLRLTRLYAAYTGAMYRAGVPVIAGTDVGNPFLVAGYSLHEDLALLVEEAGLSPLEALRTATLNPARFLGITVTTGTVAAGKLADLVLLDASPLEDIHNTQKISAVVLNGRYLDRRALDGLLAEAATAAAR